MAAMAIIPRERQLQSWFEWHTLSPKNLQQAGAALVHVRSLKYIKIENFRIALSLVVGAMSHHDLPISPKML